MPGSDRSCLKKEPKNSARSTCRGATHKASISAPAARYHHIYTVNQKKRGSLFLAITLANLNRFL